MPVAASGEKSISGFCSPKIEGGCNHYPFPANLLSGASVNIKAMIPFPKPDRYEVHLELVHEQLNWFEQMGSPSLLVRYQIH